ncbi:uncharacterized protein LOC131679480 [Topomyia yanbarensis]|uniref:uncharacterized protein LOC131679480 n=1 Tax=Topomyia yanbarensis TaxID=2498891 RepID=UPI00273CD622|nr:uncharacterized protein LOC131679480 [Topomyia yanbarensis]
MFVPPISKEANEPTIAFHARLMEKVRLCGYSSVDQDQFIRAQLLKGMRNKELVKASRTFGYETLFIVQSATREEAYAAETAQTEHPHALVVARNHQPTPVKTQPWKRKLKATGDRWTQSKRRRNDSTNRGLGRRSRCPKCNRLFHKFGSCPAVNNNCNTCGERGHFAVVYRKKTTNHLQIEQHRSSRWLDAEDDKKAINTISLADTLIDCRVGSSNPIRFLIDSGADVNTIGGDDWANLKHEFQSGNAKLEPIQLSNGSDLRSYVSSKHISVTHAFKAKIEVVGCYKPSIEAVFYVIDQGSRSLLGRSTASDLRLLEVGINVNSCEKMEQPTKFPKVPGVLVKFSIDTSIPPTKNAYYNVPAAYRESARARLSEMEVRGIIERVTSAPNWISGMSAVAKDKHDFRLVVNMRAPNRAIKREYYRLPSLDEMRVKLHGAKYFSKLDLSNAFYHLELHEQSRDLTTFLSENGMFRFTRLMFGVNCAPEIFQREMSRILREVDNIIVYIDDILMFADSLDQLRKTVSRVLRILRANNLTVNPDKCQFDKSRIKWLGHELDENGFNIDEEKIKDIRRFRQPNTVSELRSFLGLASFNGLAESCMKLVNKAMSAASASGTSYGEELNAAVQAYNAANHSVTGIPPEEVMTGRKIKRGLPLICRGKASFDDNLLNARDLKSKSEAKKREDVKRGARQCRIIPGDTVIVERLPRAKAESRFDPRKYTVTEE